MIRSQAPSRTTLAAHRKKFSVSNYSSKIQGHIKLSKHYVTAFYQIDQMNGANPRASAHPATGREFFLRKK